ncbi:hypothetical protein E4U55_003766 [Claviceps digitariae]|nr:hypothetical protein E4U55_003766 [Claviceps digitariae]
MSFASYLPGFLVSQSHARSETQTSDMAVPSTMRQWTTALDGLDELREEDHVHVPVPGDGEVLVKIHAVGLNLRDVEVCTGHYNHLQQHHQQQIRIVPCSDMCGTVVQSKSSLLKAGTRVASIFLQSHLQDPIQQDDLSSGLGVPLPGVLTEYRVFPAPCLVRVPEYLTDEQAACLSTAAVTAWSGLNWMRPLGQHIGTTSDSSSSPSSASSPPKYVFLQGTGDVSIAGLQIAHAAGYKTIITSSSDDMLKRAVRDLGADHVINSKTYWEWQEPVMEATGGRGADIIFETGPHARTLRKSFKSVAFGGTINCIGHLSGTTGQPELGSGGDSDNSDKSPKLHALDVNELALRRCVTLRGTIDGSKDRFDEMLRFYHEKQIRPLVDTVFAFHQARDALRYLAEGKAFGKVVIKIGGS